MQTHKQGKPTVCEGCAVSVSVCNSKLGLQTRQLAAGWLTLSMSPSSESCFLTELFATFLFLRARCHRMADAAVIANTAAQTLPMSMLCSHHHVGSSHPPSNAATSASRTMTRPQEEGSLQVQLNRLVRTYFPSAEIHGPVITCCTHNADDSDDDGLLVVLSCSACAGSALLHGRQSGGAAGRCSGSDWEADNLLRQRRRRGRPRRRRWSARACPDLLYQNNLHLLQVQTCMDRPALTALLGLIVKIIAGSMIPSASDTSTAGTDAGAAAPTPVLVCCVSNTINMCRVQVKPFKSHGLCGLLHRQTSGAG